MKVALFALMAVTANAFSPAPVHMRNPTQLSERVDSSDLVKKALEASKKFGASSPEARLAWEAVEEVDSSDNSAATMGTVSDYSAKVKELAEKLKGQKKPTAEILHGMADEIKAVKLSAPKVSAGQSSPELKEAVANANKATEEYGIQSSEAQVAWDIVEEIASSGSNNAMGGMMTAEECLVDAAIGACDALEELSRVLEESEQ
eukprot:scaffold1624_cov105-Cylindrotheca_fusiformis.AAC.9